jgi:formate hydrogenlyase subunit 3/multisubunit Na+/H+ antiporter MnhD subunit
MSGAAVKAGVIGLLRFLPPDVAPPGWGTALVILGMVSALYGVLVGITRTHPKTVLAYSSISQMGVILAVLGMGLSRGDGGAVLPVAFYAAHHTLVKGALFLAVGVAQSSRTRRIWIVLAPAAVLAIGMSGLPPTGGALAKLAVKPVLGDGVVGLLGSLSSAGTALLMIHFLLRLAAIPGSDAGRSGLRLPWLGMAFASVAIPWALYLTVMDGTIAYALSPAVVWPALWPVMLGGAAAFGLRRLRLPDGDFVMLAAKDAARRAGAVGAMMERLDGLLRQWPVAALLVPTVAIVLFALMVLAGP